MEVYGWLQIFVDSKATLILPFIFIVFLDSTISFIVWGIIYPATIDHMKKIKDICFTKAISYKLRMVHGKCIQNTTKLLSNTPSNNNR